MELSEFRPFTIEDIPSMCAIYCRIPPLHSDYSSVSMLGWQHYMDYLFKIEGDAAYFITRKNDKLYFRGPVGDYDDDTLRDFLLLAKDIGADPPVGVLDPVMVGRIRKILPKIDPIPSREYFDYVYTSEALRDLPGGDYLKIRNALNHFKKNQKYTIEPIGKDNDKEIREFFSRWCAQRDCDKEQYLESEKYFIAYCLDHYDLLRLEGIVLRVDGKIEASAIFEEFGPTTAVTHIEKGNPDIKGIYQAINQETAAYLAPRFEFINRESDMGIPGLRQAKERYRPHHMVEVFNLDRSQLTGIR